MTTLSDLHNAVAAVCPIVGVQADIKDRTTWIIDFDPSATDAQKAAAQAALTAFNPGVVDAPMASMVSTSPVFTFATTL